MARTAITPQAMTRNAAAAPETAADVDQANGMAITADPDRTIIRVASTAPAAGSVIVRAGASRWPAWLSGQGDITVPVAAGAVSWLGPFDSARVIQPDGSVSIDFTDGLTGTVAAVTVP